MTTVEIAIPAVLGGILVTLLVQFLRRAWARVEEWRNDLVRMVFQMKYVKRDILTAERDMTRLSRHVHNRDEEYSTYFHRLVERIERLEQGKKDKKSATKPSEGA